MTPTRLCEALLALAARDVLAVEDRGPHVSVAVQPGDLADIRRALHALADDVVAAPAPERESLRLLLLEIAGFLRLIDTGYIAAPAAVVREARTLLEKIGARPELLLLQEEM